MDLSTTLFITDLSRVAIQLGNIRRKQKRSITEVARTAGVTISFICKAEKGKSLARIDVLLLWCKALGFDQVVFCKGCV
jgi:transcriptional regulator with XRE-family HTH domain